MLNVLERDVRPRRSGIFPFMFAALLLLGTPAAQAADAPPGPVLRVCADPNNLPLSNRQQQGYENKIAELFAKRLGLPLEYSWWPQRMGFERNTLRARVEGENRFKCDLIIGVSPQFEMGTSTEPYYGSRYVLVTGKRLRTLRSAGELLELPSERRQALRIGVFAPSPGVNWLLKHGMIDQAVSYQMQNGDPASYAGQILERDLIGGDIDAAIIWGPIAGYFLKTHPDAGVKLLPLEAEPGIRFAYNIAMGVRYGEPQWKKRVQAFLDSNRDEIRSILQDYRVPLLAPPTMARLEAQDKKGDDD